jgi:anti-anti-sigma factor
VLELAAEDEATTVVLDLARNDELDVQALDMLGELADELAARGVELRLAAVHERVLELMRRGGLAERVRIEATLDSAV